MCSLLKVQFSQSGVDTNENAKRAIIQLSNGGKGAPGGNAAEYNTVEKRVSAQAITPVNAASKFSSAEQPGNRLSRLIQHLSTLINLEAAFEKYSNKLMSTASINMRTYPLYNVRRERPEQRTCGNLCHPDARGTSGTSSCGNDRYRSSHLRNRFATPCR